MYRRGWTQMSFSFFLQGIFLGVGWGWGVIIIIMTIQSVTHMLTECQKKTKKKKTRGLNKLHVNIEKNQNTYIDQSSRFHD